VTDSADEPASDSEQSPASARAGETDESALSPAEQKGKTLAGEEFDPESVEFDPESVEPEIDDSLDRTDIDVDPETATLFWRLVLVFDVAMLALAVGGLLWVVEGRSELGMRVFALGLVTFGYGVYRLWTRDTADG